MDELVADVKYHKCKKKKISEFKGVSFGAFPTDHHIIFHPFSSWSSSASQHTQSYIDGEESQAPADLRFHFFKNTQLTRSCPTQSCNSLLSELQY